MPHCLKYRVLEESLAVCRLDANAPVPSGMLDGSFLCVARTPDELSIVCPEGRSPDGAVVERGWIALQLKGPFPFSLTGVLSSFLEPLAAAQIPIFAISTFDTDYVLIKRDTLDESVKALTSFGHEEVDESGIQKSRPS